jgi:hypothetical protein
MPNKQKKPMRARKLIEVPPDGQELWIQARKYALDEGITISDWMFNRIRDYILEEKRKKK